MAESERTLDFVAIGRAAVDLYGEQIGGRLEDMSSFAKYLGGSPGNVTVGAARLGLKPGMITRVGDEHMGRFVRETLVAEGVDVSHVKTDSARLTGLAILGIRDRQTFPLVFFRENCADMAIAPEDFEREYIASAKALLLSGTHFSTPGTDAASRAAMRYARDAGTRIALDIDYRPVLWGLAGRGAGENRFVPSDRVSGHLQSIVRDCDLIVGTEEELHIAGGSTDSITALKRLRELTTGVLVVKLGAEGCVVFDGAIPGTLDEGLRVPGFPVEVFNVLGAGDAFMAGLLSGWLRGKNWTESCMLANACGALVVSRHGCAPAMPSTAELSEFLSRAAQDDLPERLHEDERMTLLHRSTTGRVSRPPVRALRFEGGDARFDRLLAEGLLRASEQVQGAGALLDDSVDPETLYAMTGRGIWIARSIGAGVDDFVAMLRAWPSEHVALLRFGRMEEPALAAALFRACIATGRELMVELEEDDVEAIIDGFDRVYAVDVRPEWWGIGPLGSVADWEKVYEGILAHDAYCRGIVVHAGESWSLPEIPAKTGIAVSSVAFGSISDDWREGRLDDAAAIDRISAEFARIGARYSDRVKQTR